MDKSAARLAMRSIFTKCFHSRLSHLPPLALTIARAEEQRRLLYVSILYLLLPAQTRSDYALSIASPYR